MGQSHSRFRNRIVTGLFAGGLVVASTVHADQVGDVFVISMENTNWSQVANQFSGTQQQILGNSAAPYINSLVNGTSSISSQVSYASDYHNVLATPTGVGAPSIHPSEPNYLWSEGGTNYGVLNDNQPFQSPGGTEQNTTQHLSGLLQQKGISWKSYQEDTDLSGSGTSKTSTVLPQNQWTVPLNNFSGTSSSYTNQYNGSHQYDYAAKHNPQVFFQDTSGGNNTTPSNPLSSKYAPLQQLQTDLTNNTVAQYNWITPDQFNDMHTGLAGSFTYNGVTYLNNSSTSGAEKIAQGDNFLSQLIPMITASEAYQNNGAIVLWWDESEPDGTGNQNDFNHTIGEIVISKLAHPNVAGLPFADTENLTHSDDLKTWEDLFGAYGTSGYLGDAANSANGINGLFAPNVIPASSIPEPSEYAAFLGLAALGLATLRRRKVRSATALTA